MSTRAPIFKTVLIGEGGVGKTSITVRYTENRFDEDMKITIGVNLATKKVEVEGENATLMLWDLGGQPRFRDVVTEYYRGSRMALACYDATRFFTLERLREWIEKLKENAPECDLIFVGNKIDERENGSGVPLEDARAFAAEFNAACVEVSAKTGEGIPELFHVITKSLLEKHARH
ncbi:MAG: Rab family GTPase [Candidatus Thorarchaeota archaeon]|jgi:small GTP-binding protein